MKNSNARVWRVGTYGGNAIYSFIQSSGVGSFLRQEAPSLIVAFLIADFFYKFGSFALECVAFLATWYALSFGASKLASFLRGARDDQRPNGSTG